jgi:cell division protein FtsB
MKVIALVLLILLVWVQYKIWLQDGGIPEVIQLQQEVEQTRQEVLELQQRNSSLEAEVRDLKTGLEAIEERARSEMGMIREGEVYYQVIDRHKEDSALDQEAAQDLPLPGGSTSPEDKSTSMPDNVIRR